LIAQVKKAPVIGGLWTFAETRPRLAAWAVLSLGIVILLLIEARDVGLLIGQWAALIVASIAVAGLCIWIVSWEDKDEDAADALAGGTPAKIVTGESAVPVVASAMPTSVAATSATAPAVPTIPTITPAEAEAIVPRPLDSIDPAASDPRP